MMASDREIEAAAEASWLASVFDPQDESPDWKDANPLTKIAVRRSARAALEAAERVRSASGFGYADRAEIEKASR